jgi:hypothetical protein
MTSQQPQFQKLPGVPPFGYKRHKDRYVLDRATAPIVRAFFEHFLLYGSLRGAVRYISQKFRKDIAVSTGKTWLVNPIYRGDTPLRRGKADTAPIVRDTHTALITRDEAAQIDRLLRRNKSFPRRTASAPRSLSGLIICQTCAQKFTIASVQYQPKSSPRLPEGYLYLRCLACPQKPKCRAIAYDQVLNAVINAIAQELPRALSSAPLSQIELARSRLAEMIRAQTELVPKIQELQASGILDQETATLRLSNIYREMANLEDQLSQLPPPNLQAIAANLAIPQFWRDLSETERRFYFREFLQSIKLEPRTGAVQLQFMF